MNSTTLKNYLIKLISRTKAIQLSKLGRSILIVALVLFLFGDITYSYLEYASSTLDGDIASGIVPADDVQQILDDPFGFNVIIKNERHPNPNRFFAHFFFKEYLGNAPLLFQKITNPIQSIYSSCAAFKLLLHLSLIYLLAVFITKSRSIFNFKFLLVSVLLSPLFQAYGYYEGIGIIDKSITYTFFYTLPLTLLLLFFSRLHSSIYDHKKIKQNNISKVLLLILAVILPFSGALISPIILIISPLLFLYYYNLHQPFGNNLSIKKRVQHIIKQIPQEILLSFSLIFALSLYSMILGTYNSTYQNESIPISIRYMRLPIGIYNQFTQNLGFPLLFILITINIFIIKKQFYNKEAKKIINSLKWIVLFATIYILLLPLGGYRPYRPNILRYDTIMPFTICLIYIYGQSTFFLLQNIKRWRGLYIAIITAFIFVYTKVDNYNLDDNYCEKMALKTIENSQQPIVSLNYNCTVLSWKVITDPNQSELAANLLHKWNVAKKKKLFYYQEDVKK